MTALNILAWGIGGGELIVIFLIILILFGAKRLPELARSLGQAKKEFTKATREVSEEVEKAKELKEEPSSKSPSSSSDQSPKKG